MVTFITYMPGGLNYPDVKLLNSLTVDTLKSSKFQLLTVVHSIFMKLSIAFINSILCNIAQCYVGK